MAELSSSSVKGDTTPPLLHTTIGRCLEEMAARHGNELALVASHQEVRWTYAEYLERIDKLATGLLSIGIGPGDRVGIWSPNCVEWCLTQFATARIGAVLVCINPAYRLFELEFALKKVRCRAIILAEAFKSSDYLGMIGELVPELGSCRPGHLKSHRLPDLAMVISLGQSASPGMFSFNDVCEVGGDGDYETLRALNASLDPHDPINIQFTSGTTGSPKGATLTHHNILNNGKIVGAGMRLTPRDRLCIPVPLYHCFGMVMGNLACMTHGAAAIFPGPVFDPLETLETVEAERCTALHGVPTMFIAELDHPRFGEFDLSSLRTGIMAGAPCPINIMRRVISEMHMRDVLIAYGQTELSPVSCMTSFTDPIDKRVGTVGKVGPHLELRIVDENNDVVEAGRQGEICTRGYSVMRGYWGDGERTRETIDADGWLRSGDLGVMDEDGYVTITGRVKDMIIRGGENIYPREIEEFLYTHPAIREVSVFGVPDEIYGEQVCVWVQLRGGHSVSEDDIRNFCCDRIAHYKIPCYVRFVDAYPMTVTGKIQKFEMRKSMIRELGLDCG